MSTQPGRLPASVYRRRRLVVGAALVAVIVIVVLLFIPRGGSDEKEPATSGSETPAPGDTGTPPAADGSTPCDPAVISITPVTDKGEYQAGENPLLSMTVVNTGTAACTFGVGTDAQLYSIVSGSDPIWNSRDCQVEPLPLEQVLEPGVELSTTPFAWDRTRSSTTTCDSERPEVVAGGGTYRLSVQLGDVESDGDTAFLLY